MSRTALVCLALAVSGAVADSFDPKNTTALTEDNWSLAEEGTWMIMFWAPWCGHCKRVKPLFADASEQTKEGVSLGMVDCTLDESKAVCEKMGVHSYPSFRYSVKGSEMYKYDGPRSTEDFVRFADRIADTSVHVLQFNQADITELQRRDDVNVFIFCTPDGQPTEQVRWIAQRGLTYLRSYYGTHPSKSEFCGDRNTAFLINDIGTQEVMPEKGTVEECIGDELDSVRLWSVMEWVMKHKSLTVDRVDQSTFHHLSRANAPLLLMYVSQEGTWEDVRPLLTVLRAVAKTPVSERFTLGWLDGVAFADWVQELVPAEELPNIIVYSVDDEGTYSDEDVRAAVLAAVEAGGDPDKRLEESVSAMLLAINSGELEPEYRGLARYVLGPAQRYAPFLLPMLKELRSSAQNDFLFFSVVIAIVVLTLTVFMNFLQLLFGPEDELPPQRGVPGALPPGMARRKVAEAQQAAAAAAGRQQREKID